MVENNGWNQALECSLRAFLSRRWMVGLANLWCARIEHEILSKRRHPLEQETIP